MAEPTLTQLESEARSEWVRLRTLINLRWLAIAGQTTSVLLATLQLDLNLDVALCMLAIGASILFNIASTIIYPANKRLSERETMLTLLFDLGQLVFLLYLSGGLNNPFALLVLAPVTISASVLRLKSTIFLGAMAIGLITVVARFHQPLTLRDGTFLAMPDLFVIGFWIALIIGVVFLASYSRRITQETSSMSEALLATQMALNREQKLTDLGGIVAAAAHELGTPLATIKLVSTELAEELQDRDDLREDIDLIREQADRCRDILRDMGRTGKDDQHLRNAPIEAVIKEAAEPHEDRGKTVYFNVRPGNYSMTIQPQIHRYPEIIHGVRNLIQNAVDFADASVWVDVVWDANIIKLTVSDDGRGYPADLIGRIGDPFVRKRSAAAQKERPGYEGMGLGLFIAKTLLQRSGGEITFANGSDPFLQGEEIPERKGAVVEVVWPRAVLEFTKSDASAPLGENPLLEI